MAGAERVDLAAYLARIGYVGQVSADRETLRAVHRAHATTIPFENLDIQLGLTIGLGIDALEKKMVRERRGGYCFEQNSLLLAALGAIGFDAMPCEARVFDSGPAITPRTHMLIVVSVEGAEWLCDVGFGGTTPLEPVPLAETTVEQGGGRYRVAPRGPDLALVADEGDGWQDQYLFERSPRHPIDFEVANWYTSTHPESRFVRTLTAQLRTTTGWKILRNLHWTSRPGPDGGVENREIARADLERVLAAEFDLHVPAGSRFRALDVGQPE
jgi:N-hydroxyarylamine O-acetyltransferase